MRHWRLVCHFQITKNADCGHKATDSSHSNGLWRLQSVVAGSDLASTNHHTVSVMCERDTADTGHVMADGELRSPVQRNKEEGKDLSPAKDEEGGAVEAGGLRGWYSRQLVKLPVAVGMCVGLLALTAVCATVSLVLYDTPDFSSPTKGFEARGTDISARMFSYYNVHRDLTLNYDHTVDNGTNLVLDQTSQIDTINDTKERIRRDSAPQGNMGELEGDNMQHSAMPGIEFCTARWGSDAFDQPAVVFEAVGDKGLFSRKALISICNHYNNHIGNTREMQANCCKKTDYVHCSDNWSLGNFVALLNERKSCQDIQDTDIAKVQTLLEKCAPYYQRKALKYCRESTSECPRDVPAECLSYDHAVHFIFHYLVPSKFVENANSGNFDLSSTILFLPSLPWYNREIYEAAFQGKDINDGETRVVALGFGTLKFDLFADFLLSDTLYIGLGAGLVFVIIWVYTGSFFITLMTIVSMLMSLVVAYFAFIVIFRLPFFPFVNIASAVLIIGIGADDTFVYLDIWRQTKSAHPTDHRHLILRETLHHAAVTMFVTSFTTASALYSSIVSSITAVRCFAVYGGTAVIVNFLFTLTWLPATVVIHSRFQDWCATLRNPCPGCFRKLHTAHSIVATAYRMFFEKYLPIIVIKLRYVWIVTLASLGVGAFCVVYVTPRLRLPTTAEFQVFRDTDLFELYDNVYKSMYDFNTENNDPLFIAAVFGVDAVDNGDHWNPDDYGTLVLHSNLDMFRPEAQEWLLEICHSLRNQSFYSGEIGPCYMDAFKDAMETPCNTDVGNSLFPCCGQMGFPYPADLFELCLMASRRCDPAIPTCAKFAISGPYFSSKDGSVKAFIMQSRSSRLDTMDYNYIDEFWAEANAWFDEMLKTKPTGIAGGWLYAGSTSYDGQQLYFYNLQRSLATDTPVSMGLSLAIAAVVLVLTTWNLLISLYAMLAIAGAFCVTVGTLVLLDWRLNIFESAILTLAVGLSVDFSIHYGVAYRLAPSKSRPERTLNSLTTVGSAITVAALSTFAAGAMMMPSTVITYVQLGTFLMLVMTVSWVYATFFFLSVCRVIGPQGNCAQIPFFTSCFRSSDGKPFTRSKGSTSPVSPNATVPETEVASGIVLMSYKPAASEAVEKGWLAEGISEENKCFPNNIGVNESNQTDPAELDAPLQ